VNVTKHRKTKGLQAIGLYQLLQNERKGVWFSGKFGGVA